MASKAALLKTRRLLDLKNALRKRNLPWYQKIILPPQCLAELSWWRDHIHIHSSRPIKQLPSLKITADASDVGWGAVLTAFPSNVLVTQTNGVWNKEHASLSINVREILALKLALQVFRQEIRAQHVLLESDNMTAVCYIRKQGGCRSTQASQAAEQLWELALSLDTEISVTHIPGDSNTQADSLSCQTQSPNDWMLNPDVFRQICQCWGPFEIDMFASPKNSPLPLFLWGWRPPL